MFSALLGLALLSSPSAVAAAPSTVVIVRSSLSEAERRLEAELAAAGFQVIVVEPAAGEDVRGGLERAAKEQRAFAAIAILPTEGRSRADVWVADRATGKTLVRTVDVAWVSNDNASTALAIRTVELLRASLLEARADQEELPRERPLPADVSHWMQPRHAAPWQGPALEAAIGLLQSVDGIGPAVGPMLRLSYAGALGWGGRVSALGPTVAPTLHGSLGTASIRQELVGVELFYQRQLRAAPLIPIASLGVGLYHLHASGTAAAPYEGESDEVWAALADCGVGAGLRLSDTLLFSADVHALLTEPRPVIVLAGERLGSAGRPSLYAAVGLTVRF